LKLEPKTEIPEIEVEAAVEDLEKEIPRETAEVIRRHEEPLTDDTDIFLEMESEQEPDRDLSEEEIAAIKKMPKRDLPRRRTGWA